MVDNHRGWHECCHMLCWIPNDCQNVIEATPYLLVYGTEEVILAEVDLPSLRIIQEAELNNAE